MKKNQLMFGRDQEIKNWLLEKLPHLGGFGDNFKGVGIIRNGLIAAIAYHDYNPDCMTMQFTLASTSRFWAHPDTIRWMLEYPFETCNVHRLSTYVYIGNKAAARMLSHIGFKQESVMDSFYGKNHHAYSYRFLRTEYARKYCGDKQKFRARDQILPAPNKS